MKARYKANSERLPFSTPTVADLLGLSPQKVAEIVEGMAEKERHAREAQALVTAQRRAARVWRQQLISNGRLKPTQETA